MSFELIEAEDAHYPKALMCRALGLSRSGNHAYSTRGPSRRAREKLGRVGTQLRIYTSWS